MEENTLTNETLDLMEEKVLMAMKTLLEVKEMIVKEREKLNRDKEKDVKVSKTKNRKKKITKSHTAQDVSQIGNKSSNGRKYSESITCSTTEESESQSLNEDFRIQSEELLVPLRPIFIRFLRLLRDLEDQIQARKKIEAPLDESYVTQTISNLSTIQKELSLLFNNGYPELKKILEVECNPQFATVVPAFQSTLTGKYQELEKLVADMQRIPRRLLLFIKESYATTLDTPTVTTPKSRTAVSRLKLSENDIPTHSSLQFTKNKDGSLEIKEDFHKIKSKNHRKSEAISSSPSKSSMWQCPTCKHINPNKTKNCPNCVTRDSHSNIGVENSNSNNINYDTKINTHGSSANISHSHSPSTPLKVVEIVEWKCKSCRVSNKSEDMICILCGTSNNNPEFASPRKPSEWRCKTCTIYNKPSAKKCNMCGSPNPVL